MTTPAVLTTEQLTQMTAALGAAHVQLKALQPGAQGRAVASAAIEMGAVLKILLPLLPLLEPILRQLILDAIAAAGQAAPKA